MQRTALDPERQSLVLPMVASFIGHIVLAVVLGLVMLLANFRRGPLIDPNEMIEVSMVVLPRTEARMPERATRAPVPKGQPDPVPNATKAPPVESDLAYRTETEPEPQGTPDRTADRDALMRKLRREQLLDNAAADVGARDREASDPDSSSETAINTGAVGANADPELARWTQAVREKFMANFHPLPTIVAANPNIECTVVVRVNESGQVLARKLHTPSGNQSYDAAAERAADLVTEVPPPPEKYRDVEHNLAIRFSQ